MEKAFYELDAPVERICSAEVPMPYAKHLEEAALPQVTGFWQLSEEWCEAMGEFCMPSLGADMQAGTLLEWKVKPGDRVRRGDIIAVVDTDKAAIEVESFESGVVEQLLVQPGEKVPVGTVLAIIRSEQTAAGAEAVMPVAAEPVAARAAVAPRIEPGLTEGVATVPRPPLPPPVAAPGERVKASPLARRLAAELGVDLSTVRGPGRMAPSAVPMWKVPRPESRPPRRRPRPRCRRQKRHLHRQRQKHRPPITRPACAAPLRRPWRAPTGKSPITTCRRAST